MKAVPKGFVEASRQERGLTVTRGSGKHHPARTRRLRRRTQGELRTPWRRTRSRGAPLARITRDPERFARHGAAWSGGGVAPRARCSPRRSGRRRARTCAHARFRGHVRQKGRERLVRRDKYTARILERVASTALRWRPKPVGEHRRDRDVVPAGHHSRPTAPRVLSVQPRSVAHGHRSDRRARVISLGRLKQRNKDIFESVRAALRLAPPGRPQYPETGAADEVGRGEGRGYTVNLPLSVGADGATYASAFERVVLPIAEQYAPDLTLVSAGYDAHERDPLGGMCLRSSDYAWLTRKLVETLGGSAEARVGFYLEGGYHRDALSDSVRSTLDALSSRDELADPRASGRCLGTRHEAELASIEAVQGAFWKLS